MGDERKGADDFADDFPISMAELARRRQTETRPFGVSIEELRALFDWSAPRARKVRQVLGGLESFLVFVGYPSSGHSIIGAMIDAHPEAAVAHELHVGQLQRLGFSRGQIVLLILENSRRLAAIGRGWGPYDYVIDSGAQGRSDRLRLVGDKRGGSTSRYLEEQPDFLERLSAHLELPVRVLHVIRDPRRHLPSLARHYDGGTAEDRLDRALVQYARLSKAALAAVARAGPTGALTVSHEDLLADPRATLRTICRFLHLSEDQRWLDVCAAIVVPKPLRPGATDRWTPAQRTAVDRLIEATPILHRYRA